MLQNALSLRTNFSKNEIKDVGIEYKKVSSELPLVSRSRIRSSAVSVDTRANSEPSSFVALFSLMLLSSDASAIGFCCLAILSPN